MSPTQTSDHPSNNSGAPFDYSAHEVRVRQARSMDMKTMMDRIDCWVPGSEAILVNPELAEVLDYRDDQSVVVEQAPGTEAWLHIPVMRPRVAPEQVTTHILYFTLAAKLNKSVQIDLLNLRREGDLIYCQPVCLRGRDYDTIFDAVDANRPNRIYDVGVMLEMRLKFLDGRERGRIELRGVSGGFA